MKFERGFFAPLIALVVMAAVGGALYYYSEKTATTTVTTTTTSTPYTYIVATSSTTTLTTVTTAKPKPVYIPVSSQPTYSAGGVSLAQVSSSGVLGERLGWRTYTNREWSYALSYPPSWSFSGGSSSVSLNGGTSGIDIQAYGSDSLPGTFITSGSNTTLANVNGYSALQTFEGGRTVYYIVHEDTAYRISVFGDPQLIETVLLTFTKLARN